jgi:hypothetical protein
MVCDSAQYRHRFDDHPRAIRCDRRNLLLGSRRHALVNRIRSKGNIVTTGSNSTFEGRRAVQYIGQYKPTRPYALNNEYPIVPAESGMIPDVSGSRAHMNISYFVAAYELSDSALNTAYREWMAASRSYWTATVALQVNLDKMLEQRRETLTA